MAAAPPLLQPSDRFALRWNDFPDNVTAIFRWESVWVQVSRLFTGSCDGTGNLQT